MIECKPQEAYYAASIPSIERKDKRHMPTKRTKVTTIRFGDYEDGYLIKLSDYLHCTKAQAIRYAIIEAVKNFEAKDQVYAQVRKHPAKTKTQ